MRGKKKLKIGVFDSGFGGLHVLRSVVRTLPRYEYVYLADTARAPYGDRSQTEIYTYTKQAVEFLFRNQCGIVIIACNTASTEALRKIQDEYLAKFGPKKKILGVLIPAAESAVDKTKGKIGIMATSGTVASGKFLREIGKLNTKVKIVQEACPILVPLIEAGEQNSPEMDLALHRHLKPLLRKNIDTLILGCTHYGILERKIRTIIGTNVAIVSQARVVPQKLKDYLRRHPEIESTLSRRGNVEFFSTDHTTNFRTLGSKLYGKPISVKKATLN